MQSRRFIGALVGIALLAACAGQSDGEPDASHPGPGSGGTSGSGVVTGAGGSGGE